MRRREPAGKQRRADHHPLIRGLKALNPQGTKDPEDPKAQDGSGLTTKVFGWLFWGLAEVCGEQCLSVEPAKQHFAWAMLRPEKPRAPSQHRRRLSRVLVSTAQVLLSRSRNPETLDASSPIIGLSANTGVTSLFTFRCLWAFTAARRARRSFVRQVVKRCILTVRTCAAVVFHGLRSPTRNIKQASLKSGSPAHTHSQIHKPETLSPEPYVPQVTVRMPEP